MAVARRYCRGTMAQSAMARALELSLGGFIHASRRGECVLAPGKKGAETWKQIAVKLNEKPCK